MVERRRSIKYWLSLVMPILLAAVLLVACDAADDGQVDQDADVGTPVVDDGLGVGEDDPLGGDVDADIPQTPMIDPTIPVDDEMPTDEPVEPTEEIAPTAEAEVTEEPTMSVEPTPEETATTEVADAPDDTMQQLVALASELIGRTIDDVNGAELATVEDILVDQSGQIRYVIVEALDADMVADAEMGNDFALTWDAIQVQTGAQPETEPDVDVDDELFHLLYDGDVTLQEQMNLDLDDLDAAGAILNDTDASDDMDGAEIPAEFAGLIRMRTYNDVDVDNASDEDLGEIEDALVDLQDGTVPYVIVDFGGFLGLGEKSVAVPFGAFDIDTTVDAGVEETITLDADQQMLEEAPEFDDSDWMPTVADDWDAEWHEFWQDLVASLDS